MADSIRVLHVDDDEEFVESAAGLLEREHEDVTVLTETSASDGVERLRNERVDCVVSDYEMPEEDGLSFLSSVRNEDADIPFILLTNHGSEEIASEATSEGVTEYMQKGVGTDQYAVLGNRIRNAVAQHRARKELEETREYFRTLVEESTDIIFIVAPDGTIEYASPSSDRVLDRIPEELEGSYAFDPIHPEDREKVAERFGTLIEDPERRQSVEFRYERGDGEWIWVEARGRNLLDDPRIEGAVVYSRDVTERRERERELQEEKAFNEAALESVADFYWVIDPEGYVTRWSDVDGEVTGYSTEEAIGMHTSTFHPDEHVPKIQDTIEDIKREGSADVEADLLRKDGERVPYQFTGTALTDDDGQIQSLCGLGWDITEQKRREAELERQNERLKEFASMVSHDLRNPINVMEGRLDLAEETGDPEQFRRCREALDRMEGLIDDLLALGRQGAPVSDVERVDLAAITEACWRNVRTGGASLRVDAEETILADESRVKQLLENLFRNAAEHSSTSSQSATDDAVEHGSSPHSPSEDAIEHGSTSNQPEADDAVEHGGSEVSIVVGAIEDGFFIADDGIGIPDDERDVVFERGYSTDDRGTGYGLAIVAEIADAHDWEIALAESESGGARFEITGVEFAR